MKKLILPFLVAGALSVPSLAVAESYYVNLSSGLNRLDNSTEDYEHPSPPVYPPLTYTYKPGVVVNGAVGLKNGDFRMEGEVGFHNNKVDEKSDSLGSSPQAEYDVSAWTFMANGYYNIAWLSSCVTPYVMGGLGSARMTRHFLMMSPLLFIQALRLCLPGRLALASVSRHPRILQLTSVIVT